MNARTLVLFCGSVLPMLSVQISGQEPTGASKAVATRVPVAATVAGSDTPGGDATVEQFREYLSLSGVGELWRSGWIVSVDPVWQRVAAPYWPESFKNDITSEMKSVDLSPVVWRTYHTYYSRDTLDRINTLLRDKGIEGYRSAKEGSEFCAVWAKHEEEGKREIFDLTKAVISRVYDRDKPLIKAARAKYLAEHPDYKD